MKVVESLKREQQLMDSILPKKRTAPAGGEAKTVTENFSYNFEGKAKRKKMNNLAAQFKKNKKQTQSTGLLPAAGMPTGVYPKKTKVKVKPKINTKPKPEINFG